MPKYDFKCNDCQKTFEKKLPMMAVHTAVCPICGSAHTVRLLSKMAIKTGGSASSTAIANDCAPSG
jgi:putative FmdB family regulatory protein